MNRLLLLAALLACDSPTAPMLPITVVDRIEGDVAVLVSDGGGTFYVASDGLSEGQVLYGPPGERERRLNEAQTVLDSLNTRDPGGDIIL